MYFLIFLYTYKIQCICICKKYYFHCLFILSVSGCGFKEKNRRLVLALTNPTPSPPFPQGLCVPLFFFYISSNSSAHAHSRHPQEEHSKLGNRERVDSSWPKEEDKMKLSKCSRNRRSCCQVQSNGETICDYVLSCYYYYSLSQRIISLLLIRIPNPPPSNLICSSPYPSRFFCFSLC